MTTSTPDNDERQDVRRPGELNARELARWGWRQLTSMRTALILLLLLALAAVPGSLIPQDGVDSLKADQWREAHTTLTPIYETLGLFNVYSTPWFAAIYLLLMVSLVGCIIPRCLVYARAMRAQPPATPANLTRLPDSTTYVTDEEPEEVLAAARKALRGYRLRRSTGSTTESPDDSVSAEKGYLREAGNLVFHMSLIIVLVAFALGSLFGYKGGVIVLVGEEYGFANEMSQYDDLKPGSLFAPEDLDEFTFKIDDFHAEWLTTGKGAGTARGFNSKIRYTEGTGEEKAYDLKVNHPLTVGGTDVFLLAHGYAPVITVRDGEGNVSYSGPTIFLPQSQNLLSFGVVKAPYSSPEELGFQGLFYPFEGTVDGEPVNLTGDIGDGSHAMLSLQGFRGDLNLDAGPQSVYSLDTSKAHMMSPDHTGKAFNLRLGESAELPDGLGSISFDDVQQWNRVQISKSPGKEWALLGVSLALVGLLGSLFIRPRRVWVRARRADGGTLVEIAALDRSGGGDTAAVVTGLAETLRGARTHEEN
ncbi:cytochrome c biogenesis protein [Nocardioides luteus]|uniref:Cytochrome c biosynthesis protein n=1 Tax=Nocardioides luteus TaxID=1844 RepID=A0ABQ5SRN2_9ACTN|nr:cytochrome c biogenesis protein ResB [Nocardioides luteus]MDR7313390.1 cytochrome c biogenesis protein [Nocardioides luteus]GGR60630.1 cytochrome c biosynthesis protein [Nocardioides luteus]GLJ66456.1 cytochrome c biosynthesis protein [Nocardioides luteus]